MNHSLRTALLVALQLGILVAIAALPLRTLARGEVVRLMVEPLDPRDLFRGDYVALRYAQLSSIPSGHPIALGGPFRAGDTIYVALTPTPMAGWPSPLALPTSLSTTHPGSLAIRGKVVRARSGGLEAEYGIESFFVPQGRGREIERAVTRLSAEVAVDRQGRAVIRRLFIGNTPFP